MAIAATTPVPRWWSRAHSISRVGTGAWLLAAAALLLVASAVAIAVRWSVDIPPHSVFVAALYPAIGALIVTRHPRNTVGWLLLGIGVNNSIVALSNAWAPVALDVSPGTLPGGVVAGQIAAWLADGIWILSHGALLTLVPLLFPDGRLPSRRWIPALVLSVTAVAVQFAAPLSVLSQLRLRRSYEEFYPDERLAGQLGELGYDLVRAAGVVAVVALVWRLSRMSKDERGVYVWFAVGAIAAVVLLVPSELATHTIAYEAIRLMSVVAIPAGAAVAILHRRAYGIDVVINRTLVYGLLTALLATVYLGSVALVDALVDTTSTVSTVAAAGATAVALSPLLNRIQRLVNRLLYGRRDEPHVVTSAVGSRLEAFAVGGETLEEVTAEIAAALRLGYVALEALTPDGPRTVASTGDPIGILERLPLVSRGESVGHLVVGGRRGQRQLSARDRAALRDVAPIAAVAVRQVELTSDLRRARGRLAVALEEERRRIRRDLHDGLGPSLATVVMGLDEALAVHRSDPQRTDRLLGDLKEQTRGAIDEIRSLVYGLRPPALDDLGLTAALRQLIDATIGRTSIEVEFAGPPSLPDLPAATEVTAYRIVQEALTNAVRHSGATHVIVSVESRRDALLITIADNGRGLPEPLVPGVGITSLRERADDVGGSVAFDNGQGTIVRAWLPVAP